ncbi:DUF636 domain protein [Annulohypoxylon truncatum]|uniref:DUF636 domain protein n=1 Tax=Annulohypoxylon truncatum TaxID=327061 RepID=UPI00200896AF|nr:DUF636 domain protein [Annulohypoxylon truncatum]KAI1214615.1 DUF636 domain protein [Annulohypoxylon truncatum]
MNNLATLVVFYNRDKVAEPDEALDTETFAARCHCGNVNFTVTLPTSYLPLNAYICSCTICRYTHGTFGSYHISLPQGVAPEWTNGALNLAVYKTPGSGAGGHGQRFFCPRCGAHNGHYEAWAAQWVVEPSLFDAPVFWHFRGIGFPRSAGDGGGLLSWLPEVGGRKLTQASLEHDYEPDHEPEVGPDGGDRLRAECKCGGVSFAIPRPSDKVKGDEYMGRYVSPVNPGKWKAFMDFCRDCRLVSSAHGVPWVLVPRAVLEPEVPSDLRFGTIKTYKSSEDVTRGFCGVCGATIFLKCKARSPTEETEVLNIAVGILRAPEGAKAEDWLTWRAGRPAWVDDAMEYDPEFIQAVVNGHREWAVEEYGEALDFEVM